MEIKRRITCYLYYSHLIYFRKNENIVFNCHSNCRGMKSVKKFVDSCKSSALPLFYCTKSYTATSYMAVDKIRCFTRSISSAQHFFHKVSILYSFYLSFHSFHFEINLQRKVTFARQFSPNRACLSKGQIVTSGGIVSASGQIFRSQVE